MRPPAFKPGSLWFAAAGVLIGLAVIAFILLWGAGPLMTMGGGPTSAGFTHWYWSLPDALSLASMLTLVLAPWAALVAALLGFRARRALSLSGPLGWVGLLLVVGVLLSMCTG